MHLCFYLIHICQANAFLLKYEQIQGIFMYSVQTTVSRNSRVPINTYLISSLLFSKEKKTRFIDSNFFQVSIVVKYLVA